MNLEMMYVLQSALIAIKKEMNEKGMSFDEFLDYYEEAINTLEKRSNNV